MKTSLILKRIGAYLIDYFIITLVSSAIVSLTFINPTYDKYKELSNDYTEVVEQYYNEEITLEEFSDYVSEYSYDINKSGYVYIISDIVIVLLYFGLFNYFTKGQTLGKKILNIKITTKDDKDAKGYQYVLRSIFLYSVIPNILILIGLCFSKSTYNTISNIASNLDYILLFIIIIMIFATQDGRGLHDYIAGTKVIDLKANGNVPEEEVKNDNIEEAQISEVESKPKRKRKKKEDKEE